MPDIPKRQENTLLLQWLSSALYWQSLALCQPAKEKYRTQQSRQLTIDLKLRGHKLVTSTLWSPYGDLSRRRASIPVRRYLSREDKEGRINKYIKRRKNDNNLYDPRQNTLASPPWACKERRQISWLMSLYYWIYRGAVSESMAKRARRVSCQGSQDKGLAAPAELRQFLVYKKHRGSTAPQRQTRKV